MSEDMSIPVFDALQRATVTYTGMYVTVLFREPDRTSSQFKQMLSFQMKRPVQFIFEAGTNTTIEWWTNGVNYNPHGPAKINRGVDGTEEHHHLQNGSLGSTRTPAFVGQRYGVGYIERWTQGKSILHRDGGPALTEIDYCDPATSTWADFVKELKFKVAVGPNTTGTAIKRRELSWYQRGMCYNPEGWSKQIDFTAFERFEPVQSSGIMRTLYVSERELRWYDDKERLHRADGPAILKMTNVREIERNGEMSRWSCETWKGEWFIRGNEIPYYNIIQWAKRNHIPMVSEPCYDRSAFSSADGELCFITDIAKEHMT